MTPLTITVELAAAADTALDTGAIVVVEDLGVALVPDVIVIEAAVNGNDIVETWRLERGDGRTVSVYRMPAR